MKLTFFSCSMGFQIHRYIFCWIQPLVNARYLLTFLGYRNRKRSFSFIWETQSPKLYMPSTYYKKVLMLCYTKLSVFSLLFDKLFIIYLPSQAEILHLFFPPSFIFCLKTKNVSDINKNLGKFGFIAGLIHSFELFVLSCEQDLHCELFNM